MLAKTAKGLLCSLVESKLPVSVCKTALVFSVFFFGVTITCCQEHLGLCLRWILVLLCGFYPIVLLSGCWGVVRKCRPTPEPKVWKVTRPPLFLTPNLEFYTVVWGGFGCSGLLRFRARIWHFLFLEYVKILSVCLSLLSVLTLSRERKPDVYRQHRSNHHPPHPQEETGLSVR